MFHAGVLKEIARDSDIKKDEPMSLHTTFRIGGPADYYVETACIKDFVNIIRYLQKEKCRYFVIGNGSNVLVPDEGYRGVIVSTRCTKDAIASGTCGEEEDISIVQRLDGIKIYHAGNNKAVQFFIDNGYISHAETSEDKNLVHAGGGILLSKLAYVTGGNGFTGLEFAGGIPGTLGGAVAMNAGAYGGEIKDVLEGVCALACDGSIKVLPKEELDMSYRNSIIQKEKMIVLDALFAFGSGSKEQILGYMNELNQKRREKQPLEHGSAGSTFKRPEGHFAGKLIQEAGLKGYRCGGIMVSDKHSGFVVNTGNGTFKQAMDVINHVKEEVRKTSGVELELEVKILQAD
ncbi:MAG: UDP-N-acetylmuramate dehydrogenase [Lachnospiraceae bacterium]